MKKILFSSGTCAFIIGLKALSLNDKNYRIFIPQFICDQIINPLNNLKIKPTYYKVNKDLSPNWNDINKKFNPKIKAILMVHYFGFNQNVLKFKNYAKKKKIYLIEDNCHGYGGKYKNKKLGYYGDVGFDSVKKILSKKIYSGGFLYLNKKNLKLPIINNLLRFKPSIYLKLKFLINNKFIFLKKYYLKFFRKDFLNYKNFENTKFSISLVDKYSEKFIKNFSIKLEKKRRFKNYLAIKNYLITKMKIYPFYKKIHSELMPLYYVGKVENFKERKKIFEWAIKKNIKILSWPSFPEDLKDVKLNKIIWNKIFCIDLDTPHNNFT